MGLFRSRLVDILSFKYFGKQKKLKKKTRKVWDSNHQPLKDPSSIVKTLFFEAVLIENLRDLVGSETFKGQF